MLGTIGKCSHELPVQAREQSKRQPEKQGERPNPGELKTKFKNVPFILDADPGTAISSQEDDYAADGQEGQEETEGSQLRDCRGRKQCIPEAAWAKVIGGKTPIWETVRPGK